MDHPDGVTSWKWELYQYKTRVLSRANILFANNNIRIAILELKTTDVKSLKY